MCFGGSTTSTQTTVPTPNPAVASAATQNLAFGENLENAGFTPYTGEMVAPLSATQQQSINSGNNVANQGLSFGLPQIQGLYNTISAAGPSSVTPNTISSAMSPYMNQYVGMALAPQLQAEQNLFAQQDLANSAAATGSGAYGDARAGQQQAATFLNQDIANQGLVGSAYTNAFNTAIGAGAQDVSNSLQAQTTNANLFQQYLMNQGTAAQGLEGASNYAAGLVNMQNALGAQQTANSQAGLNALYNQWLMGQQYPFQTSQNLNQSIAAGASGMPPITTQTLQQPNNSGFGVLGSLLGASMQGGSAGFGGSAMGTLLSALPFSDERVKENIEQVGELPDETPVYRFSYKGDPLARRVIGVMAQDVEKTNPDAVVEDELGIKHVDYLKATEPSRRLMRSLLPMAA
jgi:Chaperone of endosialidase